MLRNGLAGQAKPSTLRCSCQVSGSRECASSLSADLAALNAAFEQIMKANAELWANDTSRRDLAFKSWQDHVAEELLLRYDQGHRGDALVTNP